MNELESETTRPPDYQNTTLLCVLDWGLGHAARSLALAQQLQQEGTRVYFASSGRARAFLTAALPQEYIHELPAYNVRYPSGSMPLNVAWQLPKWVRTILRERRVTAALVQKLGVDRIISDSRFGCYHLDLPSVMLTHQLHPITDNRLVSRMYRWWLQRFSDYWVPDHPDRRLSGQLSAATGYQNVRYIGPLSRLKPSDKTVKPFAVFALLSGPEPMRTRLEEVLLPVLQKLPGQHVLVRGIPSAQPSRQEDNVTVLEFADAGFLSRYLPSAGWVICRAGYSTLMDLSALGVKGKRLFVPTPGQTEQAYLARAQVQSGVGVAVLSQHQLVTELPRIIGGV